MKARIRKDEFGWWAYDVRDDRPPRMRCTGSRGSWADALAEALAELQHMAAFRKAGIRGRYWRPS